MDSSLFRRFLLSKKPSKSSTKTILIDSETLEEFGITNQLREYVEGFTLETFKEYPLQEDQRAEDSSGNIQRDLTEWQEKHATLVLPAVKKLSQLRYNLCPLHLKERDFWRVYFALVKSYVFQYELQAIRKSKLKKMGLEDEKSLSSGDSCELEMTEAQCMTGDGNNKEAISFASNV